MKPIDLFEYSSRKGKEALPVERAEGWRELDVFLQETWDNRLQSEDQVPWGAEPADENEGEDGEEDKNRQRYLKVENGRLKAHRYVGTICLDEATTLNIWPRVFRAEFEQPGADLDSLRGLMTRNMLWWASRADYFKLSPSTGGSSLPSDLSSFFDIYIWLFANFTRDLLARQPYSQFQSEIEEGEVLRGRLVMNQYINDCLARGRWHRLVYEHEPFDFDNLLNRIIKRTCKLAQGFCDSPTVKEKLGEILFELDEVEDVFCTARDCDRVHLNRMHTEYQIVLDNCCMILGQCQADNSGRDMKRFCFLLPMDRLFEEYLRVLAQEAVQTDDDWKLVDKDGTPLALGYDVATGLTRRSFNLIHDLLFQRENPSDVVIADAKWKDREKNVKYGNFGVSQSDMYQMVAYAHGRRSAKVRLLYPAMGRAKSQHIATLTTIPGGDETDASIKVQVYELKIHADDGPSLAKGKNYTNEEDAIMKAFVEMLKV